MFISLLFDMPIPFRVHLFYNADYISLALPGGMRKPMIELSTRRDFGTRSLAAAMGMTAAVAIGRQPSYAADTTDLRSELLFDLTLTTQPPAEIGPDLAVVAVASGTFDGPRLKGTVIGPAGDWIVQRHDGSRLLDVRALLQTDDGQRVYMNWRGIAYTPPGGKLYARILPMFETGAAKYAWLNNVAAVGIYRPTAGKILYRVYEIL
jgi:hypothetical protein